MGQRGEGTGQSVVIKWERSGLVCGLGGLDRLPFPEIPSERTAVEKARLDFGERGDGVCTGREREDKINSKSVIFFIL